MPEICRFYGIVIKMYFRDHAPPHCHAEYGDDELLLGLSPIALLGGDAPARVKSMVLEWAEINQAALLRNWESCRSGRTPDPIQPLE